MGVTPKIVSARNDIVIVNTADPKLKSLLRGIKFWENDLEKPKLNHAFDNISNTVEACSGHKLELGDIPTLFENKISRIASAAYFLVLAGKESNKEAEKELQSVDTNILFPFISLIGDHVEQIKSTETLVEILEIVKDVNDNKLSGSRATLGKLDEKTASLYGLIHS